MPAESILPGVLDASVGGVEAGLREPTCITGVEMQRWAMASNLSFLDMITLSLLVIWMCF